MKKAQLQALSETGSKMDEVIFEEFKGATSIAPIESKPIVIGVEKGMSRKDKPKNLYSPQIFY